MTRALSRRAREICGATTFARIALASAVLASLPAPEGGAQTWAERKCALYRDAWADAIERRGREGLGREFLDRHEGFLASGCTTRGEVCPRSPWEVGLANLLTVLAMNEGMASTFFPFGCS